MLMHMLSPERLWEGYFAVVLGEAVARETQDTSRNTACCRRKPGPTLLTCCWKLNPQKAQKWSFLPEGFTKRWLRRRKKLKTQVGVLRESISVFLEGI